MLQIPDAASLPNKVMVLDQLKKFGAFSGRAAATGPARANL